MKVNTITFKISILYTGILGAILLVFSGILYFSISYSLYANLDDNLELKTREVTTAINSYLKVIGSDRKSFVFSVKRAIRLEDREPGPAQLEATEDRWLDTAEKLDLKDDFILFAAAGGEVIAFSENLTDEMIDLFRKLPTLPGGEPAVFNEVGWEKEAFRIITVPYKYQEADYIIQVGTSLKPAIWLLRREKMFIVADIFLVLLFTAFLGRFFARRILRTVKDIARTARGISSEDLSARVSTQHADEEMLALVEAFNDMISRLERSFETIGQFSSNVSHEMKTPLAIMRGEAEVALRKVRTPEEYQEVLDRILIQIKRLLGTVDSLLLLMRIDYRPEAVRLKPIDLSSFLHDVQEQTVVLAEKKGIAVVADIPPEPIPVQGDEIRLRSLFMNLVSNAMRFTPAGGSIFLTAHSDGRNVSVTVRDTGPGIAPKDLPRVFDRFFHKNPAHLRDGRGSGLGLSLALSIARRHDGGITASSPPGEGACFTVTLPVS